MGVGSGAVSGIEWLVEAFGCGESGLRDPEILSSLFRDIVGGRNHVLSLADSPLLPFVVGALAVPQATHYVLDGFIWKMNGNNPDLRRLLNVAPRR